MKKIYTLLFAFLGFVLMVNAQSQMGEIRGKVLDSKTKKPLDFVSVTIELNGLVKAQVLTDDDGAFIVKTLQPGTYKIKVTNLGYRNMIIDGVKVASDEITFQNVPMEVDDGQKLPDIVVTAKPPLIRPDGANVKTITSDNIMKLGTRNVNSIANTTAGVDSRAGQTPTFRGSRADGTAYYIDGIRVQGGSSTNIPQNAIDQIQVITGGTPAQYGDFIGGAIAITTKSPSRNWNRSFEYTTSSPFTKYLDNSQYNELQMGVSGPIKIENKGKQDKERVLLGFTIYGSGIYSRDPRLPATNIYKVNDAKLAQMEQNPLVPQQGGGFIPAGEYLLKSDLQQVDYRQNSSSYRFNLQGNFNYQPTTNINIRLGYQGEYSNGKLFSYAQSLTNYDNNMNQMSYTIRPYVQFTQTFAKKTAEEAKKSLISNAFYTVRFSYERRYTETYSAEHGNNLFNYGFVGTFDKHQMVVYDRVAKNFGDSADVYRLPDGQQLRLTGYYKQSGDVDTALIYHQSDMNRIKGNYTRSIYDYYALTGKTVRSISDLRGFGGIANGDEPNGVYSNLWSSPGALQGGYSKSMNETYTLYVMSEASIAPSKNPKSKHDLQFGFTYEQQFNRGYSVASGGLWTLMRQLVNTQFSGYDTSMGHAYAQFDANHVFQDTMRFDRKIVEGNQSNFDHNLREKLKAAGAVDPNGNPITDQSLLNTDGYDPSMYNINMFSANELLNNGNSYVNYYGYSHTGDIVSGKPSIEKFLNDPNSRTVGAFQPVYTAAWVQDKFVFKDLIVRLGLRMERFDANQVVLKDPYTMAPAYTAGDVRGGKLNLKSGAIPSNIGDDYTVYVDNEDPNASNLKVSGFRKGNDWFDRNGNPVSDPTTLYKQSAADGSSINRNTPYLVNKAQKIPTVASFKDYTPDVKFLPRVWFSFPISTTSQFFGTYDVLAQRPTGGVNIGQIDDYFYLSNRLTGIINNPDLKMTQVTDYQIGFRQQIGQDASLGLIASYREYRNLLQQYRYVQAWPYDYTTYGNLDFSTVKSIQLEYELREIGNITLNANYMLQFANGTGSNADQSASLIQAGTPNQRSIFPLDYDVRHTLKGTFDFHYKDGKEYDGPVVGGKKIFANAGINFIFNLSSGRPYTQTINPIPEVQSGVSTRSQVKGTINGSNLPSQFYTDMNIDKNFFITSESLSGKSTTYRLRIFLSVQNLFNNINVLTVYRYTGSAYDDGYITSTYASSQLRSATNAQSLVDLYNVRVVNPNNFALPRLTRIGLALYF